MAGAIGRGHIKGKYLTVDQEQWEVLYSLS